MYVNVSINFFFCTGEKKNTLLDFSTNKANESPPKERDRCDRLLRRLLFDETKGAESRQTWRHTVCAAVYLPIETFV